MRIYALLVAAGAAFVAISAAQSHAQNIDRGLLRFAGGNGGVTAGPRFAPPPSARRVKPPRFGGFTIGGRCHGRRCGHNKTGKTPGGTITLACPKGMQRVPGRGCTKIGIVCPKGTHRFRGRCAPDVVVVKPCPKGMHRRGRRCVSNKDDVVVVKPCPKGMHRHGRRCVPNNDDVVVVTPCPKGTHRFRGRCVPDEDDVGVVKPCPKGMHRHGRRCVPNSDPVDGLVVHVDPGKECKGRRVRRGKNCVLVPPPAPPPSDVVDSSETSGKPTTSSRPVVPPRKSQPTITRVAPPVPPQVQALVQRPHRPRELVVLVANNGADDVVTDLMRQHGIVAEERHVIALAGGTIVRFRIVDNRPLEVVLAAVAADPRVLMSQPNYRFATSDSGAGGGAGLQYAPQKIRVPEAHRMARGRGIRLAILDTGIDGKHPEIAGSVSASFDSLNEGASQAEAHGTAITGIITARKSLQGVAPEAGILSVRAFASDGSGAAQSTSTALVKGIDWAFANKARLFNLSFAGPDDPLLGRVIAEAIAEGAIFVAASGNAGPDAEPAYPAAYDGVIAVTATDDGDDLFAMAQRGDHVSVAAPGVDILAPAPGGGYDVSSGTSLATAHVTGVIALMLEQEPALSQVDVRAILEKTAHRHAADVPNGTSGTGRIDAAAAANAAASLGVTHPRSQAAAK